MKKEINVKKQIWDKLMAKRLRAFTEKHMESNFSGLSDKEKTLIRTSIHVGYIYACKNEILLTKPN